MSTRPVRYKGSPVRGAISGFFAGFFASLSLALIGAVDLDSIVLTILPVAGLVVGGALGAWAPFGRTPPPEPVGAPPDVSEFTGTPPPTPAPPTGELTPPPDAPPTLTGPGSEPDEAQAPPQEDDGLQ